MKHYRYYNNKNLLIFDPDSDNIYNLLQKGHIVREHAEQMLRDGKAMDYTDLFDERLRLPVIQGQYLDVYMNRNKILNTHPMFSIRGKKKNKGHKQVLMTMPEFCLYSVKFFVSQKGVQKCRERGKRDVVAYAHGYAANYIPRVTRPAKREKIQLVEFNPFRDNWFNRNTYDGKRLSISPKEIFKCVVFRGGQAYIYDDAL